MDEGCLTPACLQESLQASQHSALLLWIPALPDAEQVQELSQTGLGRKQVSEPPLPQPKGGVFPAPGPQQRGEGAEAGPCRSPTVPAHSLAQPSRAREWEESRSPAHRARRESSPGKLKESGRVEQSFVWKDDAEKPCNVGIK